MAVAVCRYQAQVSDAQSSQTAGLHGVGAPLPQWAVPYGAVLCWQARQTSCGRAVRAVGLRPAATAYQGVLHPLVAGTCQPAAGLSSFMWPFHPWFFLDAFLFI